MLTKKRAAQVIIQNYWAYICPKQIGPIVTNILICRSFVSSPKQGGRSSSPSFAMVRKRFPDAEKGFQLEKFLKKVGVGKDDRYFWKQAGKALLCTYAIIGAVWVYNETSPLGWWNLLPRPKEERELAHLYERREFPYPGDEEAMKEFVAKGGMIGTAVGPKGFIENDKDAYNYQKELQDEKFEREAQKLWKRMKNEVIEELREKGFDV